MHRYDEETEAAARAIVDYALGRIGLDPPPLGGPVPASELNARAGETITSKGLGAAEALRIFSEVLAPATISSDHPTHFAFVPVAPTKTSALFDLVVGASSIIGASWIDGAGAIHAENEALGWLAGLAGLGPGAGGCFVSGGSAGNLSGLVAARHATKSRSGSRPTRWRIAAADQAHSSVGAAARVMDVDILPVPHDERGRLTGESLEATLREDGGEGLFAVVATAGTTNAGIVDDLQGVAAVCRARGLWLHVDAAYGGAALVAPSARGLLGGIEAADSLVIDPHKWLFAPYDCAALLYRDPALARAAHTQQAAYLQGINEDEAWSPAHYAFHLTRRARGLPFWFSLATHGTDAYREAVETVLTLTREVAEEVRGRPTLELMLEPELSVVLFRRRGWSGPDYESWCDRLLREQLGFCQPTMWEGERMMRLCFVNPRTTMEHVRPVLDSME